MNFTIDEKFKNLINPPSDDEKRILEENLIQDGVRHPLTVWKEKNVLIDGHTRLEICKKHNLKYEIEFMSFVDDDHAMSWMASNQLGRRNITKQQKDYLLGKLYKSEKKISVGGSGQNQHTVAKQQCLQNDDIAKPVRTAERIAAAHNCCSSSVERAEKFTDAVDTISALFENPSEIKNNILSGKSNIPKTELKDIAIVAESNPEHAKEQFEEVLMTKNSRRRKKNKIKEKKKGGLMSNIIQNNMLPDAMDKAFKDLMFEIQTAKEGKWATVSREAVTHYINKLNAIIAI